ncbi:hypothetical protein [uncultured Sphingomonas sp.]|uniref:hypothetical protein n=1 Tax=uncultured Sphingomonas sp. TaxID=158754 RepID=UPI0035C9DA89
MILLADQAAGRLGGGGGVDVPVARIVVAFVICAVIAGLAILLIRQRTGRGDLARWLRRVAPGRGAVEIVEVRRLSMHADLGLVRHAGREYLILVQAGSSRVLREQELAVVNDAPA